MTSDLFMRTILAVVIAGVGLGVYMLANRVVLARASQKYRGLENFRLGVPAILYFTTPTCAPCKTVQRPAIQKVKEKLGECIQIIEIDASNRTDLADYWGVLSVPTTFVIDKKGQPRFLNHGVALAQKLHGQVETMDEPCE